ncbi:AraC family transcriptional regulator [Phaeovulum sp.]|uniref:AraC family transcriptional regulator n=1 Tax=Phaeovulum sp. TaxID=2934796 RepID=UPI0039E44D09
MDHAQCAASLGKGLAEFCAARGLRIAPFMAAAGLPEGVFDQPTARISIDRFGRLLQDLGDACGDRAFGLSFGAAFRMGDTGPLGFAMLNAPTLRDMWKFSCSVVSLAADHSHLRLQETATMAKAEWSYSPLVAHLGPFADLMVTLVIRHFRNYTGADWFPIEMALQRPNPDDPAPYKAVFGETVTFDQPFNRCVFAPSDLDKTAKDADPRIYQLMRAACTEALAQRQRRTDIVLQAQQLIIARLPTGNVDLARIAEDMGIGARSLQRRLAERNTGFDTLIREARQNLSVILLMRDTMALDKIARRCGYKSSAAYSRAVTQWFGMPPGAVRRKIMAETTVN